MPALPIRQTRRVSWTIAACLGGCGETFTPSARVIRLSSLVGTTSDCPLQVGLASRDQVRQQLGNPNYRTRHGLAWGFAFEFETGTRTGWNGGPCGPSYGTANVYENDDVWLKFDAAGTLRRCEKHLIAQSPDHDGISTWRQFAKGVNDQPE